MDSSVHKIRAFVEVATLGSVSRAAEELGCALQDYVPAEPPAEEEG